MVRAAAKNYQHVAVVTDPADYAPLLAEMQSRGGSDQLGHALRAGTQGLLAHRGLRQRDQQLSHRHSTAKGSAARFRSGSISTSPRCRICATARIRISRRLSTATCERVPGALANYVQLQGKELSYNNIADADAAWECVKTFDAAGLRDRQARQSLRRGDRRRSAQRLPAGVRDRPDLRIRRHHRLQPRARRARSRSGRAAVRRSGHRAARVGPGAHRCSRTKANVRVLEVPLEPGSNDFDLKRVGGGLLVQTPDARNVDRIDELNVVTKVTAHRPRSLQDLLFAWRVAKFVKSNAIVFCRDGMTLGVGAGQMSRVDSARIASIKAQNAGLTPGRTRWWLPTLSSRSATGWTWW